MTDTHTEPVTLTRPGARVDVQPAGAALQAYVVDGPGRPADLLDGLGARDEAVSASGYRGAALVPWPNRVRHGRWTDDDGDTHQLEITEPARDTAIHGLAASLVWEVRARTEDAVTLGTPVGPAPGYPFALDVTVTYALHDTGLDVTTVVTNTGEATAPYGVGFHPYLSAGEPGADTVTLQADAATWLAPADDGIATTDTSAAGTRMDLRTDAPLAGREMDDCVGDLARDADGRARVRLTGTTTGHTLAVWMDASYRWVMVFTGDGLPVEDRRRRAVAVEPMTCPPDALRTGRDLLHLAPGEQRTHAWGLTVSR